MWLNVLFAYLAVLTISKICGLVHYKAMDGSSKVMVIYVFQAWLCETSAVVSAYAFHNNVQIYHVFSAIQLLIVCWYYHRTLKLFRRYPIAIITGVIGVAFAIINRFYFQPNEFNTNFLIAQSIVVITMTLISLYELLASDDKIDLTKHPQFWFSCLLLIFWSFTFTYWLMQVVDEVISNLGWIAILVNVVNIICYSGFAFVFLSFRKRKLS